MARLSDLILYKDHHIIALNKPAGVPTHEDQSGHSHAHRMAMAYAHRNLYIVHRLDRRVSGVLVFAKTKAAIAALSAQWRLHQVKKVYLAIVPFADIPHEGTLRHWLTYDSIRNLTFVHNEEVPKSDEAVLQYRVLQVINEKYMLVCVNLVSGRKHQIRVQLGSIGIPIRGDRKYGSRLRTTGVAIDLHSYILEFRHPVREENVRIVAPIPEDGAWQWVDQAILTGL